MITQAIPDDEGVRQLTLADPDDPKLRHLAVVGDTYTILISGADTAGHYALIDMLIPAGGGPPPHRHDFEEMFHVLEGEIEVTLRGETSKATIGATVNVPALAPHSFHNPTNAAVRLLYLVSPAGIEECFAAFGDPVPSRITPAPQLSDEAMAQRMQKAVALAPSYRIDTMLPPK